MNLKLSSEELSETINEVYKDAKSIKRVNSFFKSKDIDPEFSLHKKSRSASDASENQNVEIGEIVKSLVFIGEEPVLVLVQGNKKASEEKIREAMNFDSVRLAEPGEVKNITDYRVGTVSPFDVDIKVIVDKPIMELEKARPAAGSTCLGVEIEPKKLKEITNAEIHEVHR